MMMHLVCCRKHAFRGDADRCELFVAEKSVDRIGNEVTVEQRLLLLTSRHNPAGIYLLFSLELSPNNYKICI